jgi:hypothetical protein
LKFTFFGEHDAIGAPFIALGILVSSAKTHGRIIYLMSPCDFAKKNELLFGDAWKKVQQELR